MDTQFAVSKVDIRKIENGYILSWYDGPEDNFATPFVEFHAPSLEATFQRLAVLFQGQ